eukprot:152814_1
MSTYTWKIADPSLVRQIKNAKNKAQWSSPMFSGGGFRWFLDFSPNGYDNTNIGYAYTFLRLASLPPKVKSIQIGKELRLIETDAGNSASNIFDKDNMNQGWQATQLQTKKK